MNVKQAATLRGNAALTNLVVSVLLVLTLAGLVNYLSFRHFERWDLTSSARFAVSSRTRAVVRGLNKDVKIYLFLSPSIPAYEEVRELLRKYQSMSSRLTVDIVDPDRDPQRYSALAQRFGLLVAADESGPTTNAVAVAVSGERTHKIAHDDLISLDMDSMGDTGNEMVDVKTERAFTSAIIAVTQGRNSQLCVTTGHGEWTREPSDTRSLAAIAEEFLELDNIELSDLELTPTATVPTTCDAVFVIGPQRVFEEEVATKLGAYVRSGGHLFIAVDPVFRETEILPTGLETMLAGFGIVVGKDVVVERAADHQLANGQAMLEGDFVEHPITHALRAMDARVAMRIARSVDVREGSTATVLLRGSGESYGETDLNALTGETEPAPGAGDTQGPVGLLVAWSSSSDANDTRAGRLVVLGDTDLLQTEILNEPRFGNFDLLSGITGFLASRPQMITIAPRRVSARSFTASTGDALNVALRVVVLIPLAFVLLGLSVWWSRRA